jgi:hypothetical protein
MFFNQLHVAFSELRQRPQVIWATGSTSWSSAAASILLDCGAREQSATLREF